MKINVFAQLPRLSRCLFFGLNLHLLHTVCKKQEGSDETVNALVHVEGKELKIPPPLFRPDFFLFLNQNICCGYSKEPSQRGGSFEHPKHMFKLL